MDVLIKFCFLFPSILFFWSQSQINSSLIQTHKATEDTVSVWHIQVEAVAF